MDKDKETEEKKLKDLPPVKDPKGGLEPMKQAIDEQKPTPVLSSDPNAKQKDPGTGRIR